MVKYFTILYLILISTKLLSQTPPWQWAKEANSGGNEYASDISTDAATGNSYIVGNFDTNLSAVYGSSLSATYGSKDGFVAKYNVNGNVLWAFKIGGTGADEANSVFVDPSGDIYITGYFSGTADFDPSTATFNLSSSGGTDGFIAKYNSSGNFLWAIDIGGGGDDYSNEVYSDANGVYATGSYKGSCNFRSTNTTTTTSFGSFGNTEAFGVKYNSSGVVQWAVSASSDKDDVGWGINADNTNVYFIGEYDKDLIFYNKVGATVGSLINQTADKAGVYIAAYNQTGGYVWSTNVCSNGFNYGRGIAQDASNLYITGSISNTASFKYPNPVYTITSASNSDIFVAKLSKANGAFIWAKAEKGTGGLSSGKSAHIDASGNLYVTGYFTDGIDFTSSGGLIITATNVEDVFITSYNSSGTFQWVNQGSGNGTDIAYGVSSDNFGAVYIAGQHKDATVFGPTSLTNSGGTNIFIAKIGCGLISNNVINSSQTICGGSTPNPLIGSLPTGGGGTGTYNYLWEQSIDNTNWLLAAGTNTTQNYSPSSLLTTTYYRRSVTTNGYCSSVTPNVSVSVTITTISLPIANAGSNQTICSATTALGANTPTVGSGLWTIVSGTASITSPSLATTNLTSIGTGTTILKWTISNGTVCSTSSTISIIKNANPTSANAGNNQTICSNTTTLAGNSATSGTGLWSVISGTATITSPTLSTSNVTAIASGSNVLQWTISNGVCASTTSTVQILTDLVPPTLTCVSDQTLTTWATCNYSLANYSSSVIVTDNCGLGGVSITQNPAAGTALNLGSQTVTITATDASGNSSKCTFSILVRVNTNPTIVTCGDSYLNETTIGNGNNGNKFSCISPTLTPGHDKYYEITVPATNNIIEVTMNNLTDVNDSYADVLWIGSGCPGSTCLSADRFSKATQKFLNGTNKISLAAPGPGTYYLVVDSRTDGITKYDISFNCLVSGIEFDNTGCTGDLNNDGLIPKINGSTTNLTVLPCTQVTVCHDVFIKNAKTTEWLDSVSMSLGSCYTNIKNLTPSGINNGLYQSGSWVGSYNSSLNLCTWRFNHIAPNVAFGDGSYATNYSCSIAKPQKYTFCFDANISNVCVNNPDLNINIYVSDDAVTISGNTTKGFAIATSNQFTVAIPTVANAGSNQAICSSTTTLGANIPTAGTGLWTILSGTASITTPSLATTSLTGIGTGTTILQWAISNGTCSTTSTISIIKADSPSIADAGINQNICTKTTSLNANIPAIGTGVWTLLTGTASITNPNLATSGLTGIGTGTTILQWTISNAFCPSSTSTISVIKDVSPSNSIAGPSQTICATTATLGATVPIIGTGLWTVLSGTASITTPTLATSSITGIGTGTTILQWTVSNSYCQPSTSTVSIIKDFSPSNANAGFDQTICTTTATLGANLPVIGKGLWTVLSGSASIITPSLATTSVTGIGTGTTILQWSISNGTCPSTTSTVTIIKNPNPTIANAGSDQNICSPTATLTGNTPIEGTGFWTVLSGTASITTPTLETTDLTGIGSGITILQWTISNNICPSSTSTVSLIKDLNPSFAIAGSNQTICAITTTLGANLPTIGSGLWSIVSGTASINSSSLASTNLTGIGTGTTILQWTISNGSCPSSSSTISIVKDADPSTASAGSNSIICTNSLTLGASPPVIGNGLWTIISGTASITTPSLATTGLTNIGIGTNILQWTISNGTCPSKTSTISIIKDADPTPANAGSNQTICASTTILGANLPTIGSGLWSIVSGTASITSSSLASTNLTGIGTGTTILQWTISNGSCPSSSSTISIIKDADPSTASAGSNSIICTNSLTLGASPPVIGNGLWTIISGTASITTPSLATTGLTSIGTGTNILQWTISNGTCPSKTSTISIIRDQNPSFALAGSNQTICASTTTLGANLPTIGSGLWSIVSGTASITSTSLATSPLTGIAKGTTILQWAISNGSCPTSTSNIVIVNDANPSKAIAGVDQTICSTSVTLGATAPLIGIGKWASIGVSPNVSSINNPFSLVNFVNNGVYRYEWTTSNGVCPNSKDTVEINVGIPPTIAQAGADLSICSSSTNLGANSAINGTATWSVLTGGGTINNLSQSNSVITNLSFGQNNIIWSISNLNCPTSVDTIKIYSYQLPSTAFAGNDIVTSENEFQLNGNSPSIGVGTWHLLSGNCVIENITNPSTLVTNIKDGEHFIIWTIANGVCPISSDTISLYKNGVFIPELITPNDDGVNDYFIVNTINNQPNVSLTIYDRWGNIVYQNPNYRNEFNGLNSDGKQLVEDTYYIILDIPKDKTYTKYLTIKRK